jgi:hypothetical protein
MAAYEKKPSYDWPWSSFIIASVACESVQCMQHGWLRHSVIWQQSIGQKSLNQYVMVTLIGKNLRTINITVNGLVWIQLS